MKTLPAAFFSYVRFEDEHEHGRLTALCLRLAGEIRMQTGEAFEIFQDRKDIAWGQQWKTRIEESLDSVTFLIPIITPGFFKSEACRGELETFLAHESKLQRVDLILPLYYVSCPVLDDVVRRETDPLARVVAARQHVDWRELRFEPMSSATVGRMLESMARQIIEALTRGRSLVPAPKWKGRPVASGSPPSSANRSESLAPADVRSAPMQRHDPPTKVVDAMHRGDYSTITAALKAAAPGDRILIRPGLYREGLVIDKPVEIIGDGPLSEIVVEAEGKHVVLFQASMGRLTDLTLRQMGGGGWYGVNIAQGRLDLECCDITSLSLACVAIHHGADPRLRGNRIHDGSGCGVHIYENGRGTLENNEICGNKMAGIVITSGGDPILRDNRIHDGKDGGVYVFENGLGTLEGNEIFGDEGAGVSIAKGGNPTLRGNRIRDGKGGGVFVYENGLGTLDDNDVYANVLAGIEIKEGGNPTLRGNRIHDGKQGGVLVWENGEGILESNEIFANAFAGVEIRTGGNPTLRGNRIRDGRQSGAKIHDGGRGTLENNEIFGNARAGVEIRTAGNPTLRFNRIHDGKSVGVFVIENGLGVLENNEIIANVFAAVEIRTGGNPTLRSNRIINGDSIGISVHVGGRGQFEENDLRGSKQAWRITEDCLPLVKRARNQE